MPGTGASGRWSPDELSVCEHHDELSALITNTVQLALEMAGETQHREKGNQGLPRRSKHRHFRDPPPSVCEDLEATESASGWDLTPMGGAFPWLVSLFFLDAWQIAPTFPVIVSKLCINSRVATAC